MVCHPQFDIVFTGQSSVFWSPGPGFATGIDLLNKQQQTFSFTDSCCQGTDHEDTFQCHVDYLLNVCRPVASTLNAKSPFPRVWKSSRLHSLNVLHLIFGLCFLTSA
eukprot:SAG22_NODE_477_length_9978_cov_2.807268_6_plen_107_part_00